MTAPIWIPIGLAIPLLAFWPIGVYLQYSAAKDDPQLIIQARATCMGCLATTIFLGCIAGSAGMLCAKLDGITWATWSFQVAMIPIYVFEGLLLLTYSGAPLRVAAEGLLWKALRVVFLVLLAMRLDGADIWWIAVIAPLAVWVRVLLYTASKLTRTLATSCLQAARFIPRCVPQGGSGPCRDKRNLIERATAAYEARGPPCASRSAYRQRAGALSVQSHESLSVQHP